MREIFFPVKLHGKIFSDKNTNQHNQDDTGKHYFSGICFQEKNHKSNISYVMF